MKYITSGSFSLPNTFPQEIDPVTLINKSSAIKSYNQLVDKAIEYIERIINNKVTPDFALGRNLYNIIQELDHSEIKTQKVFLFFLIYSLVIQNPL